MSHDSAKPLWGGRFSESPTGELELFGASLPFDQRLWREDIRGSKAHARMLAAQNIISEQDFSDIVCGLDEIAARIEAGEIIFDASEDEDIHMAIERRLTELIGEAGGRLHTGRSRNDQVALDFRMACRSFSRELQGAIADLQTVLLKRAEEEFGTIMPGYTHLQLAQPILVSQHLLSYFWQLSRDFERAQAAYRASDACPLGSAALAGTTYPLDRHMTARELGFSSVIPNSLDAVSDRDFACDLVYACMMCQLHLSRICEELVIWSSSEFGFVEMDDSHATGSSIMPQKKNPDFAELVRGKTGRVVGDLVSLATTIKGIPLAYDKDLQEDKEPVFDAIDTLIGSLHAVRGMIETMAFKHERLEQASRKGYMAATDLADYLVGKGMPFREAHGVVGRIVADCVREDIELQDLSLAELQSYSAQFGEDTLDALDIAQIVARRLSYGGTGDEAVRVQLGEAKERMAYIRDELA